jgi:predicted dehydrogenase
MTGVAFIVNSTYQHRQAIQNAFTDGYNIVSEKPITFSQLDTLNLIAQADNLGLRLFSTNTFLFADYLACL